MVTATWCGRRPNDEQTRSELAVKVTLLTTTRTRMRPTHVLKDQGLAGAPGRQVGGGLLPGVGLGGAFLKETF